MATDGETPENDAVRVAALEGAIAALEARLAQAEGTEREQLRAELAARRRELDRVRD
ncbi:MAG: hypothetical protein ABEJ68_11620 [Halobacteriaceae archaeon]